MIKMYNLKKMHKNGKFFFYASGIFICYFYFGILQEKITRGKYYCEEVSETDGTTSKVTERYTFMLALCGVQFLANFIFARCMLAVWPQGEDKTRRSYYASCALTYLLGMVCSNMALQWVSYPTQVVGKSAKPIPVMLLGVLIGHKSYPFRKYLFVFLIVAGIVLFMFKDKGNSKSTESGFGLGELLLLLSLTMDGLTGAVQERMRSESAPSAQQLMKNINAWSCLFVTVGLIFTGEGVGFTGFLARHPHVVYNLAFLAVAGALGQLFILLMVSEFGPLPCSVVTTTRKFFTVLGSVMFFGNTLLLRQWAGAIAVFSGLFLDALYGKSPKRN